MKHDKQEAKKEAVAASTTVTPLIMAVVTPEQQERQQLVHKWKVAMSHGDLGEAELIRKRLKLTEPVPEEPPVTEQPTEGTVHADTAKPQPEAPKAKARRKVRAAHAATPARAGSAAPSVPPPKGGAKTVHRH
jgi:hypothetical protein